MSISRSLWQRRGLMVACIRLYQATSGALSVAVRVWDLLKEVTIIFITSTIVWLQVKQQGGNTAPHQQKIGLKIYWAWPRSLEQDPVSPSVSFSHQEASISLLSFSIRGQTDWKPQSQKTNRSDHMDHSLTQWNCEPCHVGPPEMESSDKMWSTGEGNGKPLQYSCLENFMNSTKIA